MRVIRFKYYFCLSLIIFLTFPTYIRSSRADVLAVQYQGMGNFLPIENCSLIMTNASATFNLRYPKTFSGIVLNFKGNYTIYNPDSSLNMTLVAPFSPNFEDLESTCIIRIGENHTPFDVLENDINDNPWQEYLYTYLDWRFPTSRNFVMFNVSIPENESIIVEVIFDTIISKPFSNDVFTIFYDVGTSRAWNGTITERVEFIVDGMLPDSYSDYKEDEFEYNCTVLDMTNGTSYSWEWEDERIMVNSVHISYNYPNRSIIGRMTPFIIFPALITIPIIIIAIKKRKSKRKSFAEPK